MPYQIRKKPTGDLIALIGLNIIPLILLLERVGVVSLFGERWYWYLITAVCCLVSIPIWARFLSAAPLVEMDEEHITFFVGLFRKRPVQVSRGSLINALNDSQASFGERTNVLRLIFIHGSLQGLLDAPFAPYLMVSRNEVVIQSAFIDGDLSRIADTVNAGNARPEPNKK